MLFKIIYKLKELFFRFLHKDHLLSARNIVCYMTSGEEFLPPLSKDEEERLLALNDQGDVHSTERLIEHNLRLVAYIARRYIHSTIEYEDLISIGAIGLIKAVKTFKTDKNIRFATYASRCIQNEILMQLRKTTKVKNNVSLDKPLSEDRDGNPLLLGDIMPCDDDLEESVVDEPCEKEIINCLVSKLNVREREIMMLRFGLMGHEELTQREVAEKLGISQSYISRLEKRILNKMKIDMEKELTI